MSSFTKGNISNSFHEDKLPNTEDHKLSSLAANYSHRFCSINHKWQNQQSYRQKRRVQYVLYAHLIVWALVFLRLLPQFAHFFGIELEFLTGELSLPPIQSWEITWMVVSLPAPLLGLASFQRNEIILLRGAMIVALLGGYLPVFWGVMSQLWELADFYQTRTSEYSLFGVPLVVIWYVQFTACIQIHGFTIFFGLQLVKIWRAFKKEN